LNEARTVLVSSFSASQAALPSADHAAEIADLQRESERLRMERDILKSRSRFLLEFRNEILFHRIHDGRQHAHSVAYRTRHATRRYFDAAPKIRIHLCVHV
jgi:hypothetical protein